MLKFTYIHTFVFIYCYNLRIQTYMNTFVSVYFNT